MELRMEADGRVALGWAGRPRLLGFELCLRLRGAPIRDGDLAATPWEEGRGADRFGAFRAFRRLRRWEGTDLLGETLFLYEGALRHEVRFLQDLSGLQGSPDFWDPAVLLPLFTAEGDLRHFLCTFGLDGAAGDYPGGYWPEAHEGRVKGAFRENRSAPSSSTGTRGRWPSRPGSSSS